MAYQADMNMQSLSLMGYISLFLFMFVVVT